MSENRMRRVAGQLKKDISQIIASQIKDPRIAGIISITAVKVSRDFRYASVFVSVYGSVEERENTLKTLKRAAGYIRGEIGSRINLRYTPEINFYLDNSIEYGTHIDQIIKSLKENETGNDDRSEQDS